MLHDSIHKKVQSKEIYKERLVVAESWGQGRMGVRKVIAKRYRVSF